MNYRILPFAVSAILLLTASHTSLVAQDETRRESVGTLTCTAEASDALNEPATKNISCVFKAFDTDEERSYSGEIIHEGSGVEPNAEMVLVWTVWWPKKLDADGELLGKYYPLKEHDPFPAEPVANLLGGGPENGIVLEPVVNPGPKPGLHKSMEIIELELRPART